MRCVLIILGTLALAPPTHAGVYRRAERQPHLTPAMTRAYITRLRSAAEAPPGVPQPESFRAEVLHQLAELERVQKSGLFTPLDRIDLSGCYLRLGRSKDALALLLEEKSDHFMLQANLASAYFLGGELEMAVRTQARVLAAWPEAWVGWSERERLFYRECERALLRLFENRRQETRDRKAGDFPIDPIFPGLRYVGPEGTYVAGGLSPSMRDRLPSDGGEVLFQLCKWYPTDRRLYWQLGELLNVFGQIDQAAGIFDELVDAGRSGIFRDLGTHRRVLRDALPAYREILDPNKRGVLMSQMLLLPRPMLGAPVVGTAASAAGAGAAVLAVPYFDKLVPPPAPPATTDPSTPGLGFEWRHLVATFAMGFLVAALAGWQLQVWMGRKSAAG